MQTSSRTIESEVRVRHARPGLLKTGVDSAASVGSRPPGVVLGSLRHFSNGSLSGLGVAGSLIILS